MNDNEIAERARCSLVANPRKRTVSVIDRVTNKEFGPFDKVRISFKIATVHCSHEPQDTARPAIIPTNFDCKAFDWSYFLISAPC